MIGGALALPLLAGAGAVAARLWLPGLIRERVARAIETHTGLSAHVGHVSVGLSSITLTDVAAGDAKGVEPMWIAADGVTLQLGLMRLWSAGVDAITAVRVASLRVEVRRDHHEFATFGKRIRPVPATAQPTTPTTRRLPRELQIDRISLLASDDAGIVVDAQAEHVSLVGDVLTAQLNRVRVGSTPGAVLTFNDVEVNAERADGSFGLRDMHVGDAVVALANPDSPSLRSRVSRLVALNDDAAGAPDTADTDPTYATLTDAVMRRLSQGSLVAIERASVSDGGHVILRDLKTRVQMTQADELLLDGVGRTSEDGVVEWKLRLWPRQLRGDGNLDLEHMPLSLLSAFLPNLPWHDVGKSTVDAQLVLQGDGASRVGWSGRMSLTDVALYSPQIAPEAVELRSISLQGRGHFVPVERRLEIAEGSITVAKAAAEINGAIEWADDHYLIDLSAKLPRSACEDVLGAIPRALLGDIAAFHLSGFAAASLRLKADSRALSNTELELDVDDRCDFVEVPTLADLRRFTGPFTHYAVEPDETVFEMDTGPGTEHWTDLDNISPLFVHAVLSHEDTQFFVHHGFSPQHIRGALVRNLEAGRYVLGASTISMQLVKNLLLRREKTLARKAQEVVLTWWVERTLDKRDILELYLNVIEYGPSVYGIRNAAQYYFSREPSELSPAEAVFLSTILPNPKSYHSFFEQKALSGSWIERMRSQIQRMQARGWYAPETAAYGLKELEAFRFFPEGSVRMPTPMPMPTRTSPLPYQPGASADNGLPTLDQLNFATIDGGE